MSDSHAHIHSRMGGNPITPYTNESSAFEDHPHSADYDSFSSNSSDCDSSCDTSTHNSNTNNSVDNNDNNSDTDSNEECDEAALSLEELLYSASSYHAIVQPVSFTMIFAALASVYINNDASREFGEEQFASSYNVWQVDHSDNSSNFKNLMASVGNTLIMVTVIGSMTFGIVLLYKYRCMKCLIGYMILSSASLLGLLGEYMASIAIQIYHIPIDVITYFFLLYNFAIVGVIAIFYQNGIPNSITQTYLVCTSIILAWHLSHFDDWTAWTLLVMLALYDLCAVLSPCGPLKALVNLMQQKDAPDMPGLLYEAHLPKGTNKPGNNRSSGSGSNSRRSSRHGDNSSSSSSGGGNNASTNPSHPPQTSIHDPTTSHESESNLTTQTTTTTTTNIIFPQETLSQDNNLIPPTTTSTSTDRINNTAQYHLEQKRIEQQQETQTQTQLLLPPSHDSTEGPHVFLPLAIAKIYNLPLVSNYTTFAGSRTKKQQQKKKKMLFSKQHQDQSSSSSSSKYNTRTRRRRRNRQHQNQYDDTYGPNSSPSTINESPLLADDENNDENHQSADNTNVDEIMEPMEEFYKRKFTIIELLSEVEVKLPLNGGRIEKVDGSRNRFHVIGKNGQVKRELFMNKKGKVFDVTNDEDNEDGDSVYEDDPSSIRLGLVSSYTFIYDISNYDNGMTITI